MKLYNVTCSARWGW